MKAILEFSSNEEEAVIAAIHAPNLAIALGRIRDEVFRPARKHGYPDQSLEELLEDNPGSYDIIEKLEQKFSSILAEEGVGRYD